MKKASILLFSFLMLSNVLSQEGIAVLRGGVSVPGLQPDWIFDGTTLAKGFRGGRDIVLMGSAYEPDTRTDLLLHFDSPSGKDATGSWILTPSPAFKTGKPSFSGDGAASFSGPGSGMALKPSMDSLFSKGSVWRDFSIEFWLYPANVDSGEIILSWESSILRGKAYSGQSIIVSVTESKLTASFKNLFAGSSGNPRDIFLSAKDLLVPRTWSHHLFRFDSGTGMVEYSMNGTTEDIAYATETGRESGTVLLPMSGTGGLVRLAPSYSGLMDELRVMKSFVEKPIVRAISLKSGIAYSPVIDLGYSNSSLKRLDAVYSAPGNAGVEFSVRSGESSGGWSESRPEWIPVSPGTDLRDLPRGRFLQVRCELFPDGTGTGSPGVSEITLSYERDEPPPPPARLLAKADNGAVRLTWTIVPEKDIAGYYVYYGERPGEYFGTASSSGPSPLVVSPLPGSGTTASLTVQGLSNGTLYYFAVASFDGANPPHVSEFSPEASARPTRTVP